MSSRATKKRRKNCKQATFEKFVRDNIKPSELPRTRMKKQLLPISILFFFSALIGCNGISNSPDPVPTTTTAALSAASFDFGNNLVNNTLTQTVVAVTNTGAASLTMVPALSGDPSYSIATGTSCTQQLAPGISCNVVLNYAPKASSAPATQNAMLNLGFGDVPAGTPQTVAITGTAAALPAGQVTTTDNPQVALYTVTLPFPGSVTVNFGTDTNYGLKTWTQSTDTPGGAVSIFVAGMKATTTYHMQAAVKFSNGISANDADHTFTTKAVPANMKLNVSTTTTTGMTPQPGLELLNPLSGTPSGIVVTDLSGNVLWTYADPGNQFLNIINGVKMLPNGDILMAIGPLGLPGPGSASIINEIREVNLAGDTVREISIQDLNSELASASCAECKVTLASFHHASTTSSRRRSAGCARRARMALTGPTAPRTRRAFPAPDSVRELEDDQQ